MEGLLQGTISQPRKEVDCAMQVLVTVGKLGNAYNLR